jgi:hypothetical protein
MINFCRTCNEFARILGAKILSTDNNVCTVTFMTNIRTEILGIRTQSPLALLALFSFESLDDNGRTLNLGETVILENEINDFIFELKERWILVTALHNHWLFDNPRLMYIHFESIDKPLDSANKVAGALKVLKRYYDSLNNFSRISIFLDVLFLIKRL